MIKFLLIIRSYFRLGLGVCPKCNSDAPEKDNCKICDNFYGCPTDRHKQKWYKKYIIFLNTGTPFTKEEVEKMFYEGLSNKDQSLIRFVETRRNCGVGSWDHEYDELMEYKKQFLKKHGV